MRLRTCILSAFTLSTAMAFGAAAMAADIEPAPSNGRTRLWRCLRAMNARPAKRWRRVMLGWRS
jgi:hypothetical protein